jgi:hypothetical protein
MTPLRCYVKHFTAMTLPRTDLPGQPVHVELILDTEDDERLNFVLTPDQAGLIANQLRHEVEEARK